MLSRTADSLFWLSRYVERADNTARIIDAASRLASMPIAYSGDSNEWESAIAACGAREAFFAKHPAATRETVIDFLAFAPENPSSIRRCFDVARANARAVRTALTVETWEVINSAWLDLKRYDSKRMDRPQLNSFLASVKEASLRFDGSAYRTMLRNDVYYFSRLGIFVERADNTARILDVKYHVLLPEPARVGGGLDYFQWTSILRSVSALTAYHWVYRDSVRPWLVADLLVLNEQLPRSLASCYRNITEYLDSLAQTYGKQGPSQRLARSMRTRLKNAEIKEIFQSGLHEFLESFTAENYKLGVAIADQYLT
ncbi:MAG: alpha-E domain-containing protein [Bauldia sp.]|nr:alpha-E domain-containing protein [Bauldia sp.]